MFTLALSRCKSKEDAEDVCQEVFVALLNKKQPFKNNEHMKAWLIKTTIDRSKNAHRYESRHPRISYDPALHEKTGQNESPNYDRLHDAVELLSPDLKETLQLYYREGYSTKEIASQKGVEESSIRARLHRARKKIAAILVCTIMAFVIIFASASLPMQKIPEALAIDFATDTNASLDDLPVKAIQRTDNRQAIVTFETNLTWSIDEIERVTYNLNADNTKLYPPRIGTFYTPNGGKLGSTKDAIQTDNGEATIILNIEVSVYADKDESNDKLCDAARRTLEGKALTATVYLKNGTSKTAECVFAE